MTPSLTGWLLAAMVALVGYTYTNDINGLRFQANANLERIEKAVAIQNQTVATQQQIILTINKTHDRYEALFRELQPDTKRFDANDHEAAHSSKLTDH
jgi:hypothetical protein